uniref:Protein phosphatase 1 regulatory subunit 42 n=1 Tax=Sinocyclocheilus anshuiensis TaxID=1608454 RepID=A0A671T986_9TELE
MLSFYEHSEIFIGSPEVGLVLNLKCIINYINIEFFQETLCILNISKNNIDEIWDLAPLRKLTHLYATDNQLQDIQELETVFSQWSQLRLLDLNRNPACHKPKYRDRLITACKILEDLDGKQINELSRQFLINWKASKDAKKKLEDGEDIKEQITNQLTTDFRVGPQHPFAHDRSSSLSKPSEYGKPGVIFRADQVQGDSRGRRDIYSSEDWQTLKICVLGLFWKTFSKALTLL